VYDGEQTGPKCRYVGISGGLLDADQGREGQELLRYNNPKAKWATYKKIILDPVMIA